MNEIRLGRTQVSNEAGLVQAFGDNNRLLLSIVQAGDHLHAGFRFVVERIVHVPATEIMHGYEHWTEAYRSGIYQTVDEAMRAAEAETPGSHQWRAYGYGP